MQEASSQISEVTKPEDVKETEEHVVISSLVVETAPDYTQPVADAIAKIDGAEVHEINEYKIVVTIEAPTVDDSADIASSFVALTGVLGINLVYCNFEDDPTLYPNDEETDGK